MGGYPLILRPEHGGDHVLSGRQDRAENEAAASLRDSPGQERE